MFGMMWVWNVGCALLVGFLFTLVINLYADRRLAKIDMNPNVHVTTNGEGR